jgi:hypothetical protein
MTLTLTDAQGTAVSANVAQISDYTWGVFPHQVFLKRGETYTAAGRGATHVHADRASMREAGSRSRKRWPPAEAASAWAGGAGYR